LDYIKKNDTKTISNETDNNDEYDFGIRGEEVENDFENTRDYVEPVK
jgi:hypothetical protein